MIFILYYQSLFITYGYYSKIVSTVFYLFHIYILISVITDKTNINRQEQWQPVGTRYTFSQLYVVPINYFVSFFFFLYTMNIIENII